MRALLVLLLLVLPGAARAEVVRVLTAGAFRAVLAAAAPGFEAASGHTLELRNGTAGQVAAALRGGEAVDVVVLPPAAMEGLGLGTPRPLARVGIAVAVPHGAPRPDIGTEAGLRAALLAARAPAWIDPASGGSSGIYLQRTWERWGIAADLAPKAVLVHGGLVADALRDGRADLGLQQRSELEGHGVDVVGPLPASMQLFTVYAGAVPPGAAHAAAGAALLDWLAGPQVRAALDRAGMEAP